MPFWNREGVSSVGAFADGKVDKSCNGTAGCNPATTGQTRRYLIEWLAARSTWDQRNGNGERKYWHGSLLEGKREVAGLDYRRQRYYHPAASRFSQEDPIGLAGGLNLYGFSNGDPVNYSDPFGLCPVCFVYLAFEVGSTAYDIYDLAKVTASVIGGKASRVKLAITAMGAGAGIFGFGGGYGKAGRETASLLIRDATNNPGNWKAIGSFTEAATNKKARGGVSIQTVLENEAGDRVVRHTVRDKSGKVLDDHYRPIFKPRDVDRPRAP